MNYDYSSIYPDCDLLFCEQRTDEWFSSRKGILTASEFGPWLMGTTKTALKARESAICKLIAQAADAPEAPNFENWAMQRGTDLEPEALAYFQNKTGNTVREVGFARSKHGLFGCSPDGLIPSEASGFEGKCPVPATHVKYRRAGSLPEEYKFQCHGFMAVTGATSIHFQSYCPGLSGLSIFVERDDFTEVLLSGLIEFSQDLEAALADEAQAWQAEYGKESA